MTVTRTTATPGRTSPASRTAATRTVTVTPSRPAGPPLQHRAAPPRRTYVETRAATPRAYVEKPAAPVRAKPARPSPPKVHAAPKAHAAPKPAVHKAAAHKPAAKPVVQKVVTTTTYEAVPKAAAPHKAASHKAAPHRAAPHKSHAHHSVSHTATAKPARRPAAAARSETASRTTTDHEAIRRWAERRGGHPTSVMGTEHGREAAGVLRLDFGVKDEKLHPVDWEAFFDKFEASNLAFLYQDKTSNGKISRFHKFIQRH